MSLSVNKMGRTRWLAISALSVVQALAHEIGTTRVTVRFPEARTYDIKVATDASALAEKLEAVQGRQAPDAAVPNLQKILTNSQSLFAQRVKIAFDGAISKPEIEITIDPADNTAGSVPGAMIHLRGEMPEGARNFTWNFGWTFATYALKIQAGAGEPSTQWLEGGDTSSAFDLAHLPPPPTRRQTAARYLRLGFTHILPNGLDHMLFVLGIFLLSGRLRSVLLQVSAFTVAHSITLGLSMYGLVSISPRVVEPMIAVSIAYVAIENVFLSELKSWRVALVFAFGLLHGLGFAGALQEVGLPRSEFLTALLTFNLGVEAGQLSVIGMAFLLIGWKWSERDWYRGRIVVPASLAIACVAGYWTVERIVG